MAKGYDPNRTGVAYLRGTRPDAIWQCRRDVGRLCPMDPDTGAHEGAARATVPSRSRRRGRISLARSVVQQVRAHPANAASPNRAVARAGLWQIRKRLTRG